MSRQSVILSQCLLEGATTEVFLGNAGCRVCGGCVHKVYGNGLDLYAHVSKSICVSNVNLCVRESYSEITYLNVNAYVVG